MCFCVTNALASDCKTVILQIQWNLSPRPLLNCDHLLITAIFRPQSRLELHKKPLNNNPYFWVPGVVVIHKFERNKFNLMSALGLSIKSRCRWFESHPPLQNYANLHEIDLQAWFISKSFMEMGWADGLKQRKQEISIGVWHPPTKQKGDNVEFVSDKKANKSQWSPKGSAINDVTQF